MKRAATAFVALLTMVSLMWWMTGKMQRISNDLLAEAAALTTAVGAEDMVAAAQLLEKLKQQWKDIEPLTLSLAGRNHTDSVSLSLTRVDSNFAQNELPSMLVELAEFVIHVQRMCVTERISGENLT